MRILFILHRRHQAVGIFVLFPVYTFLYNYQCIQGTRLFKSWFGHVCICIEEKQNGSTLIKNRFYSDGFKLQGGSNSPPPPPPPPTHKKRESKQKCWPDPVHIHSHVHCKFLKPFFQHFWESWARSSNSTLIHPFQVFHLKITSYSPTSRYSFSPKGVYSSSL